jgi:hypothetical protein
VHRCQTDVLTFQVLFCRVGGVIVGLQDMCCCPEELSDISCRWVAIPSVEVVVLEQDMGSHFGSEAFVPSVCGVVVV